MAKAYTYEQEKRSWARNVAAGMRRSAAAAKCPICERKGAFRKFNEGFYLPIGILVKRCRWCGFTRAHDLESGSDEVSWHGKKTCEDCERRDKHSHCNECGSTKHGAAYCDNLG